MKKHLQRAPHLFRYAFIGFAVLAFVLIVVRHDYLQTMLAGLFPSDNALLAKVVSVEEEVREVNGTPFVFETATIRLLTGSAPGEETVIRNRFADDADPRLKTRTGETIVVARNADYQGDDYYMTDRYRLPSLLWMGLIFVVAILALGGVRGLTSLFGLTASIAILMFFIVPKILAGSDPLWVSLAGATAIAVVSLYLAHGFNRRTTIALAGTLVTLALASGITVAFTSAAGLLGIATEAGYYLRLNVGAIDLNGLLLAGIIIGMLGVLDDVTTGQAATVQEIKRANRDLGFAELYRRGISVGKEHIASLVNTLVLAYVGVALPLFLLLIVRSGDGAVPLWLAVNREPIAEEIVRTIVGSLALVFAVPITTLFAAYYYGTRAVPPEATHASS